MMTDKPQPAPHANEDGAASMEALRQAAMLNALPAHVALLDAQGFILSVNEAWRQFADANALVGSAYGVGLNYLEVCNSAHGDDAAQAQQMAAGIRSVLAGAQTSFSLEYPCHSPTEQRWFLAVVTPLAADPLNGAVVTHLTITERKKTEQKFKDLLEATPIAMVIVNRDADIVLVNSQAVQMFGWRREELLGQKIEILTPARLRGNHLESRNGYFAQPQARAMGAGQELLGRRKDGSEFPIEVGLNPMETAEGTLVISAIFDITERKQTQAALDEQMAELRRWSDATMDREGRILDLKHEVNQLLMQAGLAPRYPSAES